jgi:protein-S-isoprenylcysteine O-methyltransferase Ste14
MEQKMSRWGIGPIFASLSIGYGLIMLIVSRYFYPYFQIELLPYRFLTILGITLFLIGIPFFLISVVTVMRAYNADNLVTSGIFRCCRHPLYASWVVFIVPGIVVLVNSWIVLTTPVLMYIILYILVQKEEIYLEKIFGSEYFDYKKRVPIILPYGWLKRA